MSTRRVPLRETRLAELRRDSMSSPCAVLARVDLGAGHLLALGGARVELAAHLEEALLGLGEKVRLLARGLNAGVGRLATQESETDQRYD